MDKRTEADSMAPKAARTGRETERADFSAARARATGISARSAVAVADVDLFGEVRSTLPLGARKKPVNSRRPSPRPQAAPPGQEQLQGATLPFTDPIPARRLARSTPPRIAGLRTRIETQVDETLAGVALGGTLTEALPDTFDGALTVIRLIECDIDLREGPILRQTRPRPDDYALGTTAGFWDLLAEASADDRVAIDDVIISVFARGCTIWWAGAQTLFYLTLNRDLVSLCQSYFRCRSDILEAVERVEKAEERTRNFALRLQDRQEWNRRIEEREAARAARDHHLDRYGHHPLYPPHYL